MKHNLFQQSKWSRTIDLNTTHIVLFRSPCYVQQIGLFGRQLNYAEFLSSYVLAIKQPFGNLLIDIDPKKTSDALRFSSNIVPAGPLFFYLPSAKAVVTNVTDERERSMYASPNATSIGYQVKKVNQVSYKKVYLLSLRMFLERS